MDKLTDKERIVFLKIKNSEYPLPTSKIAAHIGVNYYLIKRLLEELEKRGLISYNKDRDSAYLKWEVTDKGREYAKEIKGRK